MKKYLVYLGLLLLPVVSLAGEELSADYQTCMESTGGEVTEILKCISAEISVQDARLNTAYQAARTKLESARSKQLQVVQRMWLTYRKANCQFYNDVDGGAAAKLRVGYCMVNTTSARATELENIKFIQH